MIKKKIVIAGGSGFIGEELAKYFGKDYLVNILSRQSAGAANNRNRYSLLTAADKLNIQYVKWDAQHLGEWVNILEDADMLINLAGKTVNCRYTEKNKKEILDSRTQTTRLLARAVQSCKNPPALWINASSATIYRHAVDKPQDEYTGEYHDGFSVSVCKEWEKAFYETPLTRTRKIALRMAITLGAGGVLIPYFNLLKFGLGGRQGTGEQMFSWIHIEDTCRMIEWLYKHPELEGTFNCCSPGPVSNKDFMRNLRGASGTRTGLPAFTWMLKMGAFIIGTETELVLKSRWVLPTRILESGFTFKYPGLRQALNEILSKVPVKQYRLF